MAKAKKQDWPRISLKRADKLLARLKHVALDLDLYGLHLNDRNYQTLVASIAAACSSTYPPLKCVSTAASYLRGKLATYDRLNRLFKFLSVNPEALKEDRPIYPESDELIPPGWVLVKFSELERSTPLWSLRGTIEWGPWYGHEVVTKYQPWAPVFLSWLRKLKVINRKYKTAFPVEIVGLYSYVQLHKPGDSYSIAKVGANGYIYTLNKPLIEARRTPCEKALPYICADCPIGRDQCWRASIPLTMEQSCVSNSN